MDPELKNALLGILGSKTVAVLTQVGIGVGLLYAIVKFFKFVEELLADDTKLGIAVELLDRRKRIPTFQNWPDTFAKVFDSVFGEKHLSWKCFWRSAVASYAALLVTTTIGVLLKRLDALHRGEIAGF